MTTYLTCVFVIYEMMGVHAVLPMQKKGGWKQGRNGKVPNVDDARDAPTTRDAPETSNTN
jgi:hypothetical protein